MQKHALTLAMALLGVGLVTACGGDNSTSPPAKITYKATLTGANERPNPNSSTAIGTWTGVLDPSTNTMTYTLNYSGLSGNSSGAHIHAQADANGTAGVVLNFASFAQTHARGRCRSFVNPMKIT